MPNNFLSKIWGDAIGVRCVVSGKMQHAFFDSNTVKFPKNKDVWYAPAIFSGKARKAEQVVAVKSFWLDIDIGKDNRDSYHSLMDAAGALRSFCDDLELPDPSVIRSGNGLHVYWILDRHIEPAKWHRIARALHLACKDRGLLADAGITIDIARILRVPGTKNYKDPANPKPVELIKDSEVCTYEELETSLSEFLLAVELRAQAASQNEQFKVDLPQTPKDAHEIANKCAQVRALRDTKGNIPEPHWYAALGVLALCVDGLETAHAWSSGYPGYLVAATDAKFERAKEFAPTTCAKFAEVNPEGCDGCPFNGKITSPVQLGESVTPLSVEAIDTSGLSDDKIAKREHVELPIPKPYICGKEGVFIFIPGDEVAGTAPEKQRILEHPLWVSRLMVGEDGSGSEIELTWVNAEGRIRTGNFRQSLMANPAAFEGALRERNIYFFWQIKTVIKYVNDCIGHVAKKSKEETVYTKFGMTDDRSGFVIGRDLITAAGRRVAHISGRIDPKRVNSIGESGTLEGWKRACNLLNEPRFWAHRFTILACLGTPLFSLSGNEGSILSLAGESSGGKTTAASVGIAAYGKPAAFTIDPKSTLNAIYEHWRQASNLPVVINEAATIRKEILTPIALAAANGKARDAMTKDRTMYDSGEWQTLTIFTSNTHMLALPDSVLSEASRRRILELSFNTENLLPLSIGRPVNAGVEKNYGVAGRLFLDYVMRHADEVGHLVNERVEKLQDGIDSVHRYNVWLIATASVAADIASALGLIEFETDDALDRALKTLAHQADEVRSPVERVSDAIADWHRRYSRQIGIKEMSNGSAWHEPPFGEAMGRYNSLKDKGGVYEFLLPVKQFKSFCIEQGIDVNQIAAYMQSVDAKETKQRLSPNGTVVRCYAIPHTIEGS